MSFDDGKHPCNHHPNQRREQFHHSRKFPSWLQGELPTPTAAPALGNHCLDYFSLEISFACTWTLYKRILTYVLLWIHLHTMSVRVTCVVARTSCSFIQCTEYFIVCLHLSVYDLLWMMHCNEFGLLHLPLKSVSFCPDRHSEYWPSLLILLVLVYSLGGCIFILNLVLGQGPYSRVWSLYWGVAFLKILTAPLPRPSPLPHRLRPLLPPVWVAASLPAGTLPHKFQLFPLPGPWVCAFSAQADYPSHLSLLGAHLSVRQEQNCPQLTSCGACSCSACPQGLRKLSHTSCPVFSLFSLGEQVQCQLSHD